VAALPPSRPGVAAQPEGKLGGADIEGGGGNAAADDAAYGSAIRPEFSDDMLLEEKGLGCTAQAAVMEGEGARTCALRVRVAVSLADPRMRSRGVGDARGRQKKK